MTNVIKVAKIGKSTNSTNPNDFVFDSSFNTFKIIKEGVLDIALVANTDNQSFTVAHDQSFIPLVSAFAKSAYRDQVFSPNGIDVELYGPKAGIIGDIRFNYVETDSDDIIFNFDYSGGTEHEVSIRYFVLEKI
jgi:hypothetical protein